ncbi:MAG: MerR family transcriptional regulator [Terriglobia bacterium]|nr:MAG: MerR family transcriptional regulator [Terriglobia bacterium]
MAKPSKQRSQKSLQTRYLTVGQTARILGISPSTLRLWENVGLVSPARSSGRYRLYNPDLLEVLKRIKYLRDVKKLSVPGIKEVLGENRPAPAGPNLNHKPDIGPRLRKMRRSLDLGLVEAAERAKISAGFLSAIELSRANPSIATLQRLASSYNTTVLEFFDVPHRSRRLIRPNQRRSLRTSKGVDIQLLSIGTKMLECMLFRVSPGAGSDGAYSHMGEEFIFMLKGTLEIWLDELECHVLQEGDSFWFESNVGHRWFNPSDIEASLIWVNTPLTF